MNKFRKLGIAIAATFALLLGTAPVARATGGFIGDYHIVGIFVFGAGTSTNYAAITFDDPGTGMSTTCDDMPNVLYIDLSTTRGRAMLSTATAAMMAHNSVIAVGSNTCISSTIVLPAFLLRSETISWLHVSAE
jgi:hypothetical protein